MKNGDGGGDLGVGRLGVSPSFWVPPCSPLVWLVKTADTFIFLVSAYQKYAGVCFFSSLFLVKKAF
jgi:hypothetical protein